MSNQDKSYILTMGGLIVGVFGGIFMAIICTQSRTPLGFAGTAASCAWASGGLLCVMKGLELDK